MKVYKIRPKCSFAWLFTDSIDDIQDLIESSEPGEDWEIDIIELPEDEFINLPEFQGW